MLHYGSIEVRSDLLGLLGVKGQVIVITHRGQVLDLVSLSPLIRTTNVVSSANYIMVLEPCTGTPLWVKREYRRQLSTKPCSTPMLRVRVEEERLFNSTDWDLLVRKTKVQLERDLLILRWLSLDISFEC